MAMFRRLVHIVFVLAATTPFAWGGPSDMVSERVSIIPRPKLCQMRAGSFQLSPDTRIIAKSFVARAEAGKLADWMRGTLRLNPQIVDSAESNAIKVELVK